MPDRPNVDMHWYRDRDGLWCVRIEDDEKTVYVETGCPIIQKALCHDGVKFALLDISSFRHMSAEAE